MLTAALFARFRSRKDHTFAEKDPVRDARRFRRPQGAAQQSRTAGRLKSSNRSRDNGDRQSDAKKPDPCSFVDLRRHRRPRAPAGVPALYNLAASDLLPDKFCVVGVARKAHVERRAARQPDERPAPNSPPARSTTRSPSGCWHASPASRPIRRTRPRSTALREQLDRLEAARETGGNRLFYLATPPNAFLPISRELGRTGMLSGKRRVAAAGDRKAVRHRPRLGQGAERRTAETRRLSTRSTGSITISARKRSRTSWCCASPTACSSRSGIATTSTTSRSPSTRSSASAIAAASTTQPARCATWCRTICSSCCRWSRWSRRSRFDAHSVRSEKADVLAAIQTQSEAEALHNSVRGAISRRQDRRHRDRGLSQDRGRQARQHHRDLCRAEADHRQLALGRRAVLSAHRQGARRQAHRDRDQVQAGAVRDVPRHAGRSAVAELSGDRRPSRPKASRCSSTPRCRVRRSTIDGVEMKFRYKDYFKAEPSHRL